MNFEFMTTNIILENYDVEKVKSHRNEKEKLYEFTIYFKNKIKKIIKISLAEILKSECSLTYDNFVKELTKIILEKIEKPIDN